MKNKAFSLIELMIVIVIVAILAAIAVPMFTNMVAQSRSADGSAALALVRAKQEVFRSTHFRYATTLTELPGYTEDPSNYGQFYTVTITEADANTFTAISTDSQDSVGYKDPGTDKWTINQDMKDPYHETKGW